MIDKFLANLSKHSCSLFLANSKIGLEKESLRVDKNGTISYKMHPDIFGSSLTNKYITTDFAEAQLELVTPVFEDVNDLYIKIQIEEVLC